MLTFYSDPGHGWLKVSADDLRDLELTPLDFSSHGAYVQGSYRRGFFFLEEDCDGPQFIAAYTAKYGKPPEINEVSINDRSQIGLR